MAAKNPAWRISADFQGGSGRGESDFRPSRPPRRRLQNRRPPGAGDAEAQGGLIKTRPSKPALSPLPRAGRRAKIAQAQTAKCALQDNVFPPPLNSGSALLWHGSVFDVATLNVFPPGSRPAGAGASIRRRHAAGEGVKESSPPSFRTSGAATAGNCFIRAVALCPAKQRFAFSPMGRHARLAAEIPDIFLPLARNENSGMTMIFLPLRINALFVLGDSFTRPELGNDTEGRGAVAVCFEGGCGGMCWPVDRPATHAAAGAAARGVLVFSLVCLVPVVRAYVAGACVGRRLRGNGGRVGGRDSGIARTPVADAVAVCSEGGCGSMCWPVDRPATHAAAGAAARGVLVFSLVCLVPVVRAYVAGACVGRRLRGNGGRVGGRDSGIARTPVADAVAVCSEGGCGSMCWPVDRPATHAAAGAAARGALIFCFGDCFTCSGATRRGGVILWGV